MEAQAEKKIFLDGEVKELIQEVSESAEESEEISVFPIARVKKIMQLAYKENLRSDTVHLLSKATVIPI